MNITEAMAVIASEARRQGFAVTETDEGWLIRKGSSTILANPRTATALHKVLTNLEEAGLRWSYPG